MLLHIEGLRMSIGRTEILRGIDITLEAGQTLGLVGESGSGKSMLGNTLMGMLPVGGQITEGKITFNGESLVGLKERRWNQLRGAEIGLVMQDPFTSLNPMMTVGDQIAESLRLHQGASRAEAEREAVAMMAKVGIPDPEGSARKFPHQMSGGQRQRIVIAIAFACRPKLLIADEPTTALDVTLQAQVLRLLQQLQEEEGTAVIMISHNVGVIAAVSDVVGVMYAGQVVEHGPVGTILANPRHPYTQALLDALPSEKSEKLRSIEGQPPAFHAMVAGCAFRDRCPLAAEACHKAPTVTTLEPGHSVRCWRSSETRIAGSTGSSKSAATE